MKCCLSSRQEKSYLQKADEIKVEYRDHKQIYDLAMLYPEKDIILQLNTELEPDWNKIRTYNILSKGKLSIEIANFDYIPKLQEIEVKYFCNYRINSFYDLQAMKELGMSQVYLAPPLTHMLPKVKGIAGAGIAIRAIPNVAYESYIPHKDGVCGAWIRPEDIEAYSKYVDVIEFEDCDLKKERTLYTIYMEDKNWPGTLDLLVSNFNYPGYNRMINPEFSQMRMSCGQKCQQGGYCTMCYSLLKLANPELFADMVNH